MNKICHLCTHTKPFKVNINQDTVVECVSPVLPNPMSCTVTHDKKQTNFQMCDLNRTDNNKLELNCVRDGNLNYYIDSTGKANKMTTTVDRDTVLKSCDSTI